MHFLKYKNGIMKKRNSSNENKNTLLLFLNRKIEKWVFEIQIINSIMSIQQTKCQNPSNIVKRKNKK